MTNAERDELRRECDNLRLDIAAYREGMAAANAEVARLSEAQEALRDLVDALEVADHWEDVRMWKCFDTARTALARLTAAPEAK